MSPLPGYCAHVISNVLAGLIFAVFVRLRLLEFKHIAMLCVVNEITLHKELRNYMTSNHNKTKKQTQNYLSKSGIEPGTSGTAI